MHKRKESEKKKSLENHSKVQRMTNDGRQVMAKAHKVS
jgi:hypothetical protein